MQFFEKSTECCVNQSYNRFIFTLYLLYDIISIIIIIRNLWVTDNDSIMSDDGESDK